MRTRCLVASLVAVALVGASAVARAGYVQEVIADNPTAYWRFEEGAAGDLKPSGSAATDTASVHGGTYQNGVPLVAGALPGTTSADFDGVSDYVTTTTLGNFGSTMNTGLTIEYWVKTTETRTIRQAMGVLNQADATGLVVDFNRTSTLAADPPADRFNYYLRDASGERLSTHTRYDDYNNGAWHHMAWVVDDPSSGNTAHIYVDGVEVSQGKQANSPAGFTNFQFPFMIGANNSRGNPVAHTDAAIDEVALYGHPLSADRIAAHYAARTSATGLPVSGDVILHLDGDAVTADGSGKVATWNDLSGQGNHAVQNINTALRPTPVPGALNGHQVVRFEHEDILDIDDIAIGPDATFIMVTQNAQQTSGGSIHRTVMAPRLGPEPYSAAGNGYALGYFRDGADAFNVSLGNGSAEEKVTHPLSDNGEYELIVYRHDGTVGEIIRDAELVASASHSRTSGFHTGDYSIGRQAGNTQRGYQGDIAEIIVYNRTLTPDEYHQVGFYLDQKYALGVEPYELRADLDYRNHTAPAQTWQDAGLLNNDGVLGTGSGADGRDPTPKVYGFSFDGGDQIALARSPSLNLGSVADGDDFSIEMWVRANGLSGQQPLVETRGSDWTGFGLLSHPDELRFFFRTDTGASDTLHAGTGTALDSGGLYQHVVAVFDADSGGTGAILFYLDGVLVGQDTWSGVTGSLDSDGAFLLGHGRAGTSWLPFDGEIGLFRLYARGLTGDDVWASFNENRLGFVPEPATLTLLGLGALALTRRRRRA